MKNWKKEIIEWIKVFAVTFILGIIITQFVGPTIVVGESMSNTFHQNDYLIVNKRAYKKDMPKYGDVVLFESNLDIIDNSKVSLVAKLKRLVNKDYIEKKILIKRVIGLPDDIIVIKEGSVFRNNEKLDEPYIRDGYTDVDGVFVVPSNEVFLMGDNRLGSVDSRYDEVGTIKQEDLIGRVIIRLYPFNKISTKFN